MPGLLPLLNRISRARASGRMSLLLRQRWMTFFAALILVLGQSLAFAHATQHELKAERTSQVCAICAAAHAGSAPAATALPALEFPPQNVSVALPQAPIAALGPIARPRSRAPPVFSV